MQSHPIKTSRQLHSWRGINKRVITEAKHNNELIDYQALSSIKQKPKLNNTVKSPTKMLVKVRSYLQFHKGERVLAAQLRGPIRRNETVNHCVLQQIKDHVSVCSNMWRNESIRYYEKKTKIRKYEEMKRFILPKTINKIEKQINKIEKS